MKKTAGLLTSLLIALVASTYAGTFGWGSNSSYYGQSENASPVAQAAEIPSTRPVNHWWSSSSVSHVNSDDSDDYAQDNYSYPSPVPVKTSAQAQSIDEYVSEEYVPVQSVQPKKQQQIQQYTDAQVYHPSATMAYASNPISASNTTFQDPSQQVATNDPSVDPSVQVRDIESPLPRFTQDPYGLPQPLAVEAVQPDGRQLMNGTKYKQSEGILTGEGMPQIHPHLGLLYVYDSNFLILPDHEIGDFIFDTSPGLSLEIGRPDIENPDYNRLNASYTANIIRFYNHSENDTIDQDADLLFRYTKGKTTWGVQQKVQTITDSSIDIGRRVHRELYSTLLSVRHDISDKTYIDLSGAQFVTNFGTSDLSDNIEWATQAFLNYKLTPKITIGVGPKIGWVDITDNPNQMYEAALARVLWEATAKLSFNLTGGLEFRQWQEDIINDTNTAIFEVGANYDPFDGTRFSIRGFRRNEVSGSIFGENFINTGFNASLRQRLYRRFYLGLSGGYEHSDYYTGSPFVTTSRLDNFYSIRPSISYVLADWGTVGLFYEFRTDDSNIPGLEFREHIAGLEASFRY